MSALGQYLSGLRIERGLSIEEMARVTRVGLRFLEALEHDDLSDLPAPVFTKGYIRAYCQALGVPADEALARYAKSAGVAAITPTATIAPLAARASDSGRRARGTLLVSFALLVGFGLALFVVALFLQSGRPEIGARRPEPPPSPAAEPRPTSAAVSAPEAQTPPRSAPPAPSEPVVVSPPATPAPPSAGLPSVSLAEASRPAVETLELPSLRLAGVVSPYRLVARASEATWLRVRTEDGRATEETIPAGEVREWVSNRPFILTVGNAAGLAFELNGRKLPPLGGRGVVITRLVLPPPEP